MSLHPSLKRAERMAAVRSVMTRTERIKWLMGKGTWEGELRPFGLPKIKIIRLKAVKKEKKEEKPEAGVLPVAESQARGAAVPKAGTAMPKTGTAAPKTGTAAAKAGTAVPTKGGAAAKTAASSPKQK